MVGPCGSRALTMKFFVLLLCAALSAAGWSQTIRSDLDQLNSVARMSFVGRVNKVEEIEVPWTTQDGLSGTSKVVAITVATRIAQKPVSLRLLATTAWTPWIVGTSYFVLATRPETGRLRFFPKEIPFGRIDFPAWADATDFDGSVFAPVVVDPKEELGERVGNKIRLLAEHVGRRFGQEPYDNVERWIQRLLDLGLNYPAQLDPDTAKWFQWTFRDMATEQVKDSDAKTRALVFGFLVGLGSPSVTDYWSSIGRLVREGAQPIVLLNALAPARSTVGSTILPLANATQGAVRSRILQCLGSVKAEEVQAVVALFRGPFDQDTAVLLKLLAIAAHRKDLEPMILRYRSGVPVYEDMTDLIKLWRENPPAILP